MPLTKPEKAIAHIANMANNDTWFGGCRALIIAKRAVAMKLPSADLMLEAVSDTYSRSSGHVPDQWRIEKCAMCDTEHLGIENALNCCIPYYDQEEL